MLHVEISVVCTTKRVYIIGEYWSFGVFGGLGTPAAYLFNYFQFSSVFKALCTAVVQTTDVSLSHTAVLGDVTTYYRTALLFTQADA